MRANRAIRLIFWRPAAFTLALHAGLVYALTVNWTSTSDAAVKPKPAPRYIQARLVEIEAPKPKPKATKPRPKPKTTAAKPKPAAAKPKPAATKPKVVAPKPKPAAAEPKRPSAEERAAVALDELAMAMESEDELLEAASDEQLTQSYVALIARTIEDNWSRPPSARNDMEAELVIQLIPTGEVVSVTIASSSGQSAFDRSAVLAVQKVERFPELQQMESRLFERNFRTLRLKFKPEDLRY